MVDDTLVSSIAVCAVGENLCRSIFAPLWQDNRDMARLEILESGLPAFIGKLLPMNAIVRTLTDRDLLPLEKYTAALDALLEESRKSGVPVDEEDVIALLISHLIFQLPLDSWLATYFTTPLARFIVIAIDYVPPLSRRVLSSDTLSLLLGFAGISA